MRKKLKLKNGRKIVLLCGPPASGKDTLTALLKKSNNVFCHFKKHRVSNKSDKNKNLTSYYQISIEEFLYKICKDEFIQFHKRYGRLYGISKKVLREYLECGKIPIIHVGKIYDLMELEAALEPSLVKILIWETKNIITERLMLRHHGQNKEIQSKLKSYDHEVESLTKINLEKVFDFVIKNDDANKTLKTMEEGILYNKRQTKLEIELEKLRNYINKKKN